MLKKIETFIIWIQLCFCCVTVLSIFIASKLYPDGNTDNKLIKLLLSHITIQTVIEEDTWSNKYPFDENVIDHYLSTIKQVKKSVENYCTTSFPAGGTINIIVSKYKDKIMNYHINSIPSIDDNQKYISDYAKNVIEFQSELSSLEVPFIYIQTPSETSIDFYNNAELVGDSLNIAERSYCLTTYLENQAIDVINIGRDYSDSISFELSSHWMPKDGLDCAKLIANLLIEKYNYNIDINVFDENNYYDLVNEYPEIKKTILDTYGYDFVVPCPKSNPEITRIYAEQDTIVGPYNEVIFNPASAWNIDDGAYHCVFTITNSLINHLKNESALCEKKILIIGDSFDWPVISYLSLACKDVTIIHNASFTGSLISYIKKTQPDIVLMIYNDAEFYEIYTEDAFYLK